MISGKIVPTAKQGVGSWMVPIAYISSNFVYILLYENIHFSRLLILQISSCDIFIMKYLFSFDENVINEGGNILCL